MLSFGYTLAKNGSISKSYGPVKWSWWESKAIVVFQEVGNDHDDRRTSTKALAKMSDPFS